MSREGGRRALVVVVVGTRVDGFMSRLPPGGAARHLSDPRAAGERSGICGWRAPSQVGGTDKDGCPPPRAGCALRGSAAPAMRAHASSNPPLRRDDRLLVGVRLCVQRNDPAGRGAGDDGLVGRGHARRSGPPDRSPRPSMPRSPLPSRPPIRSIPASRRRRPLPATSSRAPRTAIAPPSRRQRLLQQRLHGGAVNKTQADACKASFKCEEAEHLSAYSASRTLATAHCTTDTHKCELVRPGHGGAPLPAVP